MEEKKKENPSSTTAGAADEEKRSKPPDKPAKSYAEIIASSKGDEKLAIVRKQAVMRNGVPVVTFSHEEIKKSVEPLRWAMIGVFGRSRPNIDDIRKHVNCDWGLKAHVMVSIMDHKHILMRFSLQQDYMRIWTKENHVIRGIRFHVIPWTIDFDPSKESTKQPVWIQLPNLQANFFHEDYLASIASGVGKYIDMDNPTRNITRAQGARLCVEVDLMKELKQEVIVEWGNNNRKVIKVLYENVPLFCKHCHVRGHDINNCKIEETIKKTKDIVTEIIDITQKERTNSKTTAENTKAWVSRVFYPKVKKPVWRVKKLNKQMEDKIKGVMVSGGPGMPKANEEQVMGSGKEMVISDKSADNMQQTHTDNDATNQIITDGDNTNNIDHIRILKRGECLEADVVQEGGGKQAGTVGRQNETQHVEVNEIDILGEQYEVDQCGNLDPEVPAQDIEISDMIQENTSDIFNNSIVIHTDSITNICATQLVLTDEEIDTENQPRRLSLGDTSKLILVKARDNVLGDTQEENQKTQGKGTKTQKHSTNQRITRASTLKQHNIND